LARRLHAKRYAQAVFEIALETKEPDKWQSDLSELISLLGDAELVAFLENPKVHLADKGKLLTERLKDMNPLALNLVLLLVAKGRLRILGEIVEEYERLLNSYRGIEPAEVITAISLDEEEKQKLTEHLSAIVGKKVVLKPEVDPGVIGGFVARVGGKLLDGSISGKLMALRKELAGTVR